MTGRVSNLYIILLGIFFAGGFTVLGTSLYRLQVSNIGTAAGNLAEQTTRTLSTAGRRGRILDRNGTVLADVRAAHRLVCRPESFRSRRANTDLVDAIDEAVGRVFETIGTPRTVTRDQIAAHIRFRSAIPLVLVQRLDDTAFARFEEHAFKFPGFETDVIDERVYPLGTVAAHVLGYTGGVAAPDHVGLTRYYDAEKELRGRSGVEAGYNDYLAGAGGETRVTVDARGFRVGEKITREPMPGLDLVLTIDIRIQRALERAFGTCTGAGVVLDPRSGAVLAMASSPAFDPNVCTPVLTRDVYDTLTNAPAKRLQNRAIEEVYPPGSTFKPITALAALRAGADPDTAYECAGVYRKIHCWNRYGHGAVRLEDAIRESCNTYFLTLGDVWGGDCILAEARRFGLGAHTGIDIPGERAGNLEPWKTPSSMGQGDITTTPLQMAVVCAALANGGDIYAPFLHDVGDAPAPVGRIDADPAHLERVRRSMRAVVEEGTGRRIAVRYDNGRAKHRLAVSCAGKTGTAQRAHGRKDTWIIAFAPYDRPTVAISLVIENGDSGGLTTAPKAQTVLAAIFGEKEVER